MAENEGVYQPWEAVKLSNPYFNAASNFVLGNIMQDSASSVLNTVGYGNVQNAIDVRRRDAMRQETISRLIEQGGPDNEKLVSSIQGLLQVSGHLMSDQERAVLENAVTDLPGLKNFLNITSSTESGRHWLSRIGINATAFSAGYLEAAPMLRDPRTRRSSLSFDTAVDTATELGRRLFSPGDGLTNVSGLDPAMVGSMIPEMARRGQMPNPLAEVDRKLQDRDFMRRFRRGEVSDEETRALGIPAFGDFVKFTDIERDTTKPIEERRQAAKRRSELSSLTNLDAQVQAIKADTKVLSAVEDFFSDNGVVFTSLDQLLNATEDLFDGSMRKNSEQLMTRIRRISQGAKDMKMTVDDLHRLSQMGKQVAQEIGYEYTPMSTTVMEANIEGRTAFSQLSMGRENIYGIRNVEEFGMLSSRMAAAGVGSRAYTELTNVDYLIRNSGMSVEELQKTPQGRRLLEIRDAINQGRSVPEASQPQAIANLFKGAGVDPTVVDTILGNEGIAKRQAAAGMSVTQTLNATQADEYFSLQGQDVTANVGGTLSGEARTVFNRPEVAEAYEEAVSTSLRSASPADLTTITETDSPILKKINERFSASLDGLNITAAQKAALTEGLSSSLRDEVATIATVIDQNSRANANFAGTSPEAVMAALGAPVQDDKRRTRRRDVIRAKLSEIFKTLRDGGAMATVAQKLTEASNSGGDLAGMSNLRDLVVTAFQGNAGAQLEGFDAVGQLMAIVTNDKLKLAKELEAYRTGDKMDSPGAKERIAELEGMQDASDDALTILQGMQGNFQDIHSTQAVSDSDLEAAADALNLPYLKERVELDRKAVEDAMYDALRRWDGEKLSSDAMQPTDIPIPTVGVPLSWAAKAANWVKETLPLPEFLSRHIPEGASNDATNPTRWTDLIPDAPGMSLRSDTAEASRQESQSDTGQSGLKFDYSPLKAANSMVESLVDPLLPEWFKSWFEPAKESDGRRDPLRDAGAPASPDLSMIIPDIMGLSKEGLRDQVAMSPSMTADKADSTDGLNIADSAQEYTLNFGRLTIVLDDGTVIEGNARTDARAITVGGIG